MWFGDVFLAADFRSPNFTAVLYVHNYIVCQHVVDNLKNRHYNRYIMTWQEWVPLTVGIITIIASIGAFIRYITKNYLRQELEVVKHELQPNSGKSMKDQITRLESKHERLEKENIEINQKLDKLDHRVEKMFDIILKHFGE